MKKEILMLFTCMLFACLTLKAQQPKIYRVPKYRFSDTALLKRFKDKVFLDSLRKELRDRSNLYTYNNTPLAGAMPKRLNYISNNGNGFNIYQTPQDNMYILKPDSSFTSNMPVVKSLSLTMKPVEIPNPPKERRE